MKTGEPCCGSKILYDEWRAKLTQQSINAGIVAIGAYVPPRRVSNEELANQVETSDEWIFSHTGIKYRHLADEDMATSDLAIAALRKMQDDHNIDLRTIDAIIVATATQDFVGFPSTACVVQGKLGLTPIAAFDLAAGCTGFIYALEVAKGLIMSKSARRIAVIGAEKLSAITDWTDRDTCVLFGDGAGCVLIESRDSQISGIVDSVLHSEGSGASYLCIPSGGSSRQSIVDGSDPHKIHMDGRAVYNFAVRVMGSVIEELLERNDLTIDDIDWIIPHQANSRIIMAASKRLKVDIDKFYMNILEYANTSSASIPIAMSEMCGKGLLRKGNKIITVGFGAGLTYGGNYIIW